MPGEELIFRGRPNTVFEIATSDAFFANDKACEKARGFDLAFIDGDHSFGSAALGATGRLAQHRSERCAIDPRGVAGEGRHGSMKPTVRRLRSFWRGSGAVRLGRVLHDEAFRLLIDRPGRREAAGRGHGRCALFLIGLRPRLERVYH
jgi:hypothetical protein